MGRQDRTLVTAVSGMAVSFAAAVVCGFYAVTDGPFLLAAGLTVVCLRFSLGFAMRSVIAFDKRRRRRPQPRGFAVLAANRDPPR